MAFERVEKGSFGRGSNTDALISIRKSESIGINAPALELLGSDVDEVVLYHDTENDKVCIVDAGDVDADDVNPYTLSKSNGSATVGCTSWLKNKGLVPEITTRYEPVVDDVDTEDGSYEDVLLIDLNDEHSTYGSADDDDE